MATGVFSWSKTAASNASADSTISIPEGMAPSGVNDAMRAMMAAVAKWRDDISGSLLTGGTSTAYTLTTNQVFTSLSEMDTQMISFRMSLTNGSNATLNVDGLGAKALVFNNVASAVVAGDMVQGRVYTAIYRNDINSWLVHSSL